MTTSGPQPDLGKLLAERAQLALQVELLVRTEQRLYRSQNELDVQLLRLRTLARFSLDLGNETASAGVLARAAKLLGEGFAVDWVGALRLLPAAGAVELVATHDGQRRAVVDVPVGSWQWLAALEEAQLLTADGGEIAARARRCVESLHVAAIDRWTTNWLVAAVPLRHGGDGHRGVLLLAAWRPRPVPVRDGGVAEQHLPFLQLLGQHVDHAIGAAELTANLRERSAQLAHSLESLERTQQALVEARKMEAVGRLAGGVAHDFNNLLTVILGCAEDLLADLPSEDAARSNARNIVDAASRAARITQQLLALGRRQARRPVALDLGRAATESMAVLSRLLTPAIHFTVVADACPTVVEVDPAQLEQILLNLVVNARDAMPDGGHLAVRIRHATPDDLLGRAHRADAGQFAVLELSDTGIGMDEGTRNRVFEPFFTTKSSKQHAGLGLAVVYGVVMQNGGDITVRSTLGAGTTFLVLLPLADATTAPAATPPTVTPLQVAPSAAPRFVLMVEDDPQIRALLTAKLRRAGYLVTAFASAEEALAWLATPGNRPDLLLTDVELPGIGGLHLAERVQHERPGLRIAFVSGHSDALAGRRIGDQHPFLAKPFTPDQFLDFVRTSLAAPADRV